ncbi:hypothetical protein T439DRAFT_84404 [Meredithblackwellia eburnea MCA 4105]
MFERQRGETTTLYVSNLSSQTSAKFLGKLFEREAGPIIRCDRPAMRSIAFVEFYEKKDAEYALSKLYNEEVDGRKINLEWARRQWNDFGSVPPPNHHHSSHAGRPSRSRSRSPPPRRRSRSRSRERERERRRERSPGGGGGGYRSSQSSSRAQSYTRSRRSPPTSASRNRTPPLSSPWRERGRDRDRENSSSNYSSNHRTRRDYSRSPPLAGY